MSTPLTCDLCDKKMDSRELNKRVYRVKVWKWFRSWPLPIPVPCGWGWPQEKLDVCGDCMDAIVSKVKEVEP